MSIPYLNSNTPHEDDNNISEKTIIVIIKIASFILIFLFGVGFVLMPYFIKTCRHSTKFLGLANAFSGGIFLGIGLFHLLPESGEIIEPILEKHDKWGLVPVPYMLAFLSYSLILFVEKVAFESHDIVQESHKSSRKDLGFKGLDIREKPRNDDSVVNNTLLGEMIPDQSTMEDRFMVEKSKEEDQIKNIISTKGKMGSFLFMRNSLINDEQNGTINDGDNVLKGDQTSQQSKSKHGSTSIASKLTPYILLIALGLHSFFEGLALGLGDTIGRTLVMLGAILVHKWAESLSLGISFVRAKTDKTNFIAMSIVFGIISPLGVVIGWVLSESNYEIIQGIFLALSTGTFLYVACTEVIVEEFSVGGYRVIKFILYMLAAFFIGGLTVAEHFFEQSKNEDHE